MQIIRNNKIKKMYHLMKFPDVHGEYGSITLHATGFRGLHFL